VAEFQSLVATSKQFRSTETSTSSSDNAESPRSDCPVARHILLTEWSIPVGAMTLAIINAEPRRNDTNYLFPARNWDGGKRPISTLHGAELGCRNDSMSADGTKSRRREFRNSSAIK
jgi:hypothetical protein